MAVLRNADDLLSLLFCKGGWLIKPRGSEEKEIKK